MLRSTHSRTRSASSAAIRSSPKAATPRERAASISAQASPSLRHFVTLPRGILPKPAPASPVASGAEETIGAFSPTSCPRLHLQHVLGTAPRSRKRRGERLRLDFDFASDLAQQQQQRRDGAASGSDASPPLSPIPSICRTPSSESEYVSTAPSSAGPATPVHSATTSPVIPHKALRPILEALEDASKFRVRTACAACARVGSNFPCCPRCGEMWCSRECRLQSTGGKRHVCSRQPDASA